MRRAFSIEVLGQLYTIRSDADAAYVEGLARDLDGKMRQIRDGAKNQPLLSVAVLAALQLADELARERQRRTALRAAVRDYTRALHTLFSRATRRTRGGKPERRGQA